MMDALAALPSELLDNYGIGAGTFGTDAVLSLSAELQRPFCFETDTLPYAQAELKIADCNIRYGKARFTDFGVDVQAVLRGNNLDDATATLRRLSIAGLLQSCSCRARLLILHRTFLSMQKFRDIAILKICHR